jgi:hypothetical protein
MATAKDTCRSSVVQLSNAHSHAKPVQSPAVIATVVPFRQVQPRQPRPQSTPPMVSQDDLVEYNLLDIRVRQLKKELADAIAARGRKRDQLTARVAMGVEVEDGFHKVWLSPTKNPLKVTLVVA